VWRATRQAGPLELSVVLDWAGTESPQKVRLGAKFGGPLSLERVQVPNPAQHPLLQHWAG
jgi:hypothetical protein